MARREGGPGATPAVVAVRASGVPHRVLTYAHDPRAAAEEGWGLEAATALGVDPRRVHKTLCVLVDGSPAVAVVPVTARVDLKAVAAALGAAGAVVAEHTVSLAELLAADEAFIAGTACGVIGIVRANGTPIGTGTEGAATRAARAHYLRAAGGTS